MAQYWPIVHLGKQRMKTLIRTYEDLLEAKRWDIDFHLPAELIKLFDSKLICRVDDVATVAKDTRDPSNATGVTFRYIDISSIDVVMGEIVSPQEVLGEDAPSRARKVVQVFDIVVSNVRPTRGSVAVVPESLHMEIASTGFTVVRANPGINPFYLHFALRLQSTREQFRKWSTGSSYPAILDGDVEKTLIPVPDRAVQDRFAIALFEANEIRHRQIQNTTDAWRLKTDSLLQELGGNALSAKIPAKNAEGEALPGVWSGIPTIEEIEAGLSALKSATETAD